MGATGLESSYWVRGVTSFHSGRSAYIIEELDMDEVDGIAIQHPTIREDWGIQVAASENNRTTNNSNEGTQSQSK
jgi:hypothetical protein